MRPAKWVLSSTLTAALTAYGLDCVGMVTPEQAMDTSFDLKGVLA